ncbi:hypothetical protein QP027_09685 [Corynebacterium breve]|uniref:Oxidoreductase/dehydrogenase Rossmann-like domain-containing protein n=1 Tax=Corynebacterium breve TaxID=3049799 RepID=A0ABY8VD32_9CORY|nr:hypothetical protein [Corynebacterium breve]WIM67364.1 hypothetical protein QP027_09685 [Corynebacterium breve]
MSAPRMSVGVVGGHLLFSLLRETGHTVHWIESPSQVAQFDLVVFDLPGSELASAVEMYAPFARRGQIYLHTALEFGVQALDPMETSGAIVVTAHQLTERMWVTSAADELGETIVELLVGEMGGNALLIDDTQRAQIEAAMSYMNFANLMQSDARLMLSDAIENPELIEDLIPAPKVQTHTPVEDLDRQYKAFDNPGRAQAFAAMVRRHAEERHIQDAELWAIAHMNVKE